MAKLKMKQLPNLDLLPKIKGKDHHIQQKSLTP
jgi:hypothetical protein